jgi:hypothetical protein
MAQNRLNINTDLYSKFLETSLAIVGITKQGILEIRFKFDEYEVDVSDQEELQKVVAQLTENGKNRFHILVVPGKYGSITKEARNKEMFHSDTFSNYKSISIVVVSIPQRIFAKFYYNIKKHKPNFPFQLFATEELALKWISDNNS